MDAEGCEGPRRVSHRELAAGKPVELLNAFLPCVNTDPARPIGSLICCALWGGVYMQHSHHRPTTFPPHPGQRLLWESQLEP